MDIRQHGPTSRAAWWCGAAAGVATQSLFLYTVWRLFWFLRDGVLRGAPGSLALDGALSLQFAVVHSLLLYPPMRKRLSRWISSAFYGSFFCVATCLGLLLMFACWQGIGPTIWDFHGGAAAFIAAGFYGSWLALFYSLALTGLGYQTGLTPWCYWMRGLPQPKRGFQPRGAYRWFRHPVYLSFLGLIWFTPRMTLDHAVLTSLWTVYILIGSYLKDERLAVYIGRAYREYQEQTPGYPLVHFGPLGKRSPELAPLAESP
jgi:protein-S-isoprenylcysteine O-methyltransferase Ste14